MSIPWPTPILAYFSPSGLDTLRGTSRVMRWRDESTNAHHLFTDQGTAARDQDGQGAMLVTDRDVLTTNVERMFPWSVPVTIVAIVRPHTFYPATNYHTSLFEPLELRTYYQSSHPRLAFRDDELDANLSSARFDVIMLEVTSSGSHDLHVNSTSHTFQTASPSLPPFFQIGGDQLQASFREVGVYNRRLNLTEQLTILSHASSTYGVDFDPPQAHIDSPQQVVQPFSWVLLDGSNSSGTIASYQWDFVHPTRRQPTFVDPSTQVPDATRPDPAFQTQYADETYDVKLTVKNPGGTPDTAFASIQSKRGVQAPAPTLPSDRFHAQVSPRIRTMSDITSRTQPGIDGYQWTAQGYAKIQNGDKLGLLYHTDPQVAKHLRQDTFNISPGQTTFTLSDFLYGRTEQVYLNGTLLPKSDYSVNKSNTHAPQITVTRTIYDTDDLWVWYNAYEKRLKRDTFAIQSSSATVILSDSPTSGTLQVYLNGLWVYPSGYSRSGQNVTISPSRSGDTAEILYETGSTTDLVITTKTANSPPDSVWHPSTTPQDNSQKLMILGQTQEVDDDYKVQK